MNEQERKDLQERLADAKKRIKHPNARIIKSWVLGITVAVVLAGLLVWPLHAFVLSNAGNKIAAYVSDGALFLAIVWFVLAAGKETVQSVHVGITGIFGGSLYEKYFIPQGSSWIIPYFSKKLKEIDLRQITLDHSHKQGKALNQILSYDQVDMSLSFIVQYRIVDPIAYFKVGNVEEAFETLMIRSVRWFFSVFYSYDLPHMKHELSGVLMAKESSELEGIMKKLWKKFGLVVDEIKKLTDKGKITDDMDDEAILALLDDGMLKGHYWSDYIYDVALEQYGIELIRVYVDDINLPESIRKANEQKRVEDAQKESERTEVENILNLGHLMRNGYGEGENRREGFDIPDQRILDALQTERGKADRIIVDGNGGDFTKGQAVSSSKKRK